MTFGVFTAASFNLPGFHLPLGTSKQALPPRQGTAYSKHIVVARLRQPMSFPAYCQRDARTLPGISAPFPQLFDPANILSNAEGKRDPQGEVKRWRESELTHGRVAMLATLGFIAQEQILGTNAARPFPHVEGPAINHFQQVESQGAKFWLPLLVGIALAESYRVAVGWKNPASGGIQMLNDDYEPGDLGFDPLGLYPKDPKAQYNIKTKELNNGRLAMIAIAAFVVQELRVEKPIFAYLNLGGTTGTSLPPN